MLQAMRVGAFGIGTAFMLATLVGAPTLWADDAIWVPTAGGTYDWDDNANWTAAFPNAASDDASVNNNITGDQVIELNQAITLDSLTLGDADASHVITIAPGAGGSLSIQSSGPITLTDHSTSVIAANLTITGNFVLNTGTGGTVTISGVIDGPANSGRLDFNGTGTVILTGNNTHSGENRMAMGVGGRVLIGSDTAFGQGTSSTNTIRFGNNTSIESTDATTRIIPVHISNWSSEPLFGGQGNLIFTSTQASNLGGQSRTIRVNNPLVEIAATLTSDGAQGITKQGPGVLVLSGNSSYNGATQVSAGTLVAASNNALGSTSLGTTVSNGATLAFERNVSYTTAEAVEIAGNGDTGRAGAIDNLGGVNTFAGAITINAGGATIGSSAGSLTLTGGIDGNAASRPLTFNGPGDIHVTTNGIGSNVSTVTKNGSGTLNLAVASTYTGATTVSAGTLLVNNTSGSATGNGTVTVQSGATLGGSGIIAGSVVVNGGTLAPGNSPGILTVGSLTLDLGANLVLEITGPAAGIGGYDQIVVTTGGINLMDANLVLSPVRGVNFGDVLTIIENSGSGSITGTFNGLSDGDTVFVNGRRFAIINYGVGPGGEVTLTVLPEPAALAFFAAGAMMINLRRPIRRR